MEILELKISGKNKQYSRRETREQGDSDLENRSIEMIQSEAKREFFT